MKKKNRAKYTCPQLLDSLIKVSNNIGDLKSMSEYSDEVKLSRKYNLTNPEETEEWRKEHFPEAVKIALKDIEKKNSSLFTILILNAFEETETPISNNLKDIVSNGRDRIIIGTYENIRLDVTHLREFVTKLENIRKGKESEFKEFRFTHTNIVSIKNNKTHIRGNSFFYDSIKDINPDRLRMCVICENIFWAKRADSKACSPNCANALRVRRYRSLSDEEKAKRKKQRKRNSEYKQNMPKSSSKTG